VKVEKLEIDYKQEGEGTSKHISGALTLTLSAIILKILGFIYKIPLATVLGEEGMGYFNTAYTVFSVFYLLCTAGVPKAVTMLIAEAKERHDIYEEHRIIKVASSAFLVIGGIITAALILFSKGMAEFVGASKASHTLIAIAPSIIPVAISGVLRGYLSAGLKLGSIAVSQILDGVGKLVFGLILAIYSSSSGYSVELISAFTIFGVSLGAALSLIYLIIIYKINKREFKAGQNYERNNKGNIIFRILRISLPITISSLVMSLSGLLDLGMIIKKLKGIGYSAEEATSIFGNYTTLAVPMYNLVISLLAPLSVALLPAIAKCFISSDYDEANRCIRSTLSLSAFMSAPMVMGLFVFSEEILSLIFPGTDIMLGAPLLSILIPAASLMSVLLIVNSILEARGRYFVPLISMLIGSFVKVIVGYILLKNEEFGIIGAPVGTIASYGVGLFVSLVILSRDRKIKIPILKTHIIPYLNSFVSVLSARFVCNAYLNGTSCTAKVIIIILLCGVIYLILSLLSGVIRLNNIKTSKMNKNFTDNSLKKTKLV